jgi:hypothetical protein
VEIAQWPVEGGIVRLGRDRREDPAPCGDLRIEDDRSAPRVEPLRLVHGEDLTGLEVLHERLADEVARRLEGRGLRPSFARQVPRDGAEGPRGREEQVDADAARPEVVRHRPQKPCPPRSRRTPDSDDPASVGCSQVGDRRNGPEPRHVGPPAVECAVTPQSGSHLGGASRALRRPATQEFVDHEGDMGRHGGSQNSQRRGRRQNSRQDQRALRLSLKR